jgi:L-alanine-DL-glutamate epimerase-like enolase superfamily enzyme
MAFVEEAIGPDAPEGFRELRRRIDVPVCGGEIITTPKEMIERLRNDVYAFVQPDASVMGGISAVMEVFTAVSMQASANLQTLAPGVSAALMTTIAGLVVAIPSVFGYNALLTKTRQLTTELENFSSALADRLELESK